MSCVACGVVLRGLLAVCTASGAVVSVDANRIAGPVKPVNGVGQPPLIGKVDHSLFRYLQEVHVPFSRLHDTGGYQGGGVFVDIPNVFRDFDADENDPANYDFAFTDSLLAGLVEHGIRPFYRLGVSIENNPHVRSYRIKPPKDYAKWARICGNVMAHYTEGWAKGFRYDVSHWEIWNEADIHWIPEDSMMWQAPFEEYVKLYLESATYLKRRFPKEKIGGFASCGFYAAVPNAEVTEQMRYHLKCIHVFLKAVREANAPLDFFSFHSYSDVKTMLQQVAAGRKILDAYGFRGVEMCLNEWLPRPSLERVGTAEQASEIAATLIGFQNSTLDSAAIYDARCRMGKYSPLFDCRTYRPTKAYYAFMAFDGLRQMGSAVAASSDCEAVSVCAAARDGRVAVMLANFSEKAEKLTLDLGGKRVLVCHVTDEYRMATISPLPEELPPYSFAYLLAE